MNPSRSGVFFLKVFYCYAVTVVPTVPALLSSAQLTLWSFLCGKVLIPHLVCKRNIWLVKKPLPLKVMSFNGFKYFI